MPQPQIILGEHRFASNRLRPSEQGGGYKVSSNRNKMVLYFINPAETIRIEGAENVANALREIEYAFDDEDQWS